VDTANDIRKAEDRINDARKLTDAPAPKTPDVNTPKAPDASGPKAPDANTPKAPDADTPKAPTRCNSFVPGTRVLLADGSSKPIEQLTVGDQVAADDVESDEVQARTVTEVRQHAGTKTMLTFTIDVDGKDGSRTGQFTSTAEHEFWLPDAGKWLEGKHLKPGMWLETAAGTWVQITAIERHTQYQRVHNMTVDGQHDYYVMAGNTSVLVHNCNTAVTGHPAGCTCTQTMNTSRNADILGANMRGRGAVQPPVTSPHHVVASTAKAAKPAADHLRALGIDINDPINGIFLPRNLQSPNPTGAAVHSKVHTPAYYAKVNDMVLRARDAGEARAVLRYIRRQLAAGPWP
jgi:hypothetical protein